MPSFVLPPPKNKKQQGQQSAYKAYVNSHPALKPYAQQLYKAAVKYGLDPVYFASLINFESGGKPGATSSANAFGLAQIHIPSWVGKTDPRDGHTISLKDIHNPAWNVNFGAYLFSQAVAKHGSYSAAYNQGYNPGYKGPGPFRDLPKGYIAIGTQTSPTEKAQTTVETAAAKRGITDPYVTIRNGKLVNVTDPKNALKVFGQPITRSQFLQEKGQLNDLFLSYTGKNISDAYVAKVLQKGYSRYQLINAWTKRPDFTNSPVWKQQAPGYQSVWQQIYGPDSKPDQEALRYAIVNNLGGEGFASTLRARPDYVGSNEFKGAESSLAAVYTKIYGVPDVKAENLVKQATLHGWNPDQFAAYLRSQPQYTGSEEYQSRALFFATQLGLITGTQPTLVPGKQGPSPNPNTAGNLPTDPRVPAGSATATSDLVIGPAPGKPTSLAGVVQ